MTPEEKHSELERHHHILLATIDYFISIHADSFVLDNQDHTRYHYEHQKPQVERDFKQRRLDKLQKKLARLTKILAQSVDLNFSAFIKERTGYDIDIFEGLSQRVDVILFQNKIRNAKELADIGTMLQYLIATSSPAEKIDKLKSLLLKYHHKSRNRKNEYSEITSTVEDRDTEIGTISISTGPKPKCFKQVKVDSPDGLKRLFIIQWDDGIHSSTSVTLQYANGASGAIYSVKGTHPGITASWEGNFTVSIRTSKDYGILSKHKEVRNLDERITIQYLDVEV